MRIERNTNNTESKEIAHLSKELALMYLNNEIGTKTIHVTTIFDNNCWTGRIIIEEDPTGSVIGVDDAEFYADYILSSVRSKNKLKKIIEKLQKEVDNNF